MKARSVIEWDPLQPLTDLFQGKCGDFQKILDTDYSLVDLVSTTISAADQNFWYKNNLPEYNDSLHDDVDALAEHQIRLQDRRSQIFKTCLGIRAELMHVTASYIRERAALSAGNNKSYRAKLSAPVARIGRDIDTLYSDAKNAFFGTDLWHVTKQLHPRDWEGGLQSIYDTYQQLPEKMEAGIVGALVYNGKKRRQNTLYKAWSAANNLVYLNSELALYQRESANASLALLQDMDVRTDFGDRLWLDSSMFSEYSRLRQVLVYDAASNIAGALHSVIRGRFAQAFVDQYSLSFQSREP